MVSFELVHADYCGHCKNMIKMLDEIKDIYGFDYIKIEINTPEGTSKKLEHGFDGVPVLLFENEIILTGSLDDEIDLINILVPYLDILENNEMNNENISIV